MADKYSVTVEFTEPLLGTAPKNKEIYTDFVASKAPNPEDAEDEVESVAEIAEKAVTGFHYNEDGKPILYDYVVKGFFKDACSMLRRVEGTKSKKITAHKKIIDGLIFVKPRQIVIDIHGGEIGFMERPLRAETAKGPRVALAKSEMAPAGSSLQFEIIVLGSVTQAVLEEWLDYGALRGFGQWRNGGYGSFTYTIIKQ
jgi:hypothetical protein